MFKKDGSEKGIPVSVSLQSILESANISTEKFVEKRRLLYISGIAILVAACISAIAKGLVLLINLFTNLSFYGLFSFAAASPQHNHLGGWVVLIPAVGGIIVGLMALFGSKAIRGHGIPEAMEQILINDSKIKPTITYLKPLSSAIAIGTGGPFGAEGPIIATGGALGSTIGQLLHISHYERKVLLAAGATAGMSAIFGSPIAGIFLAIELLLFEFSANSIIPVALACITGAAGHHLFFEAGPVFPVGHNIDPASNTALFIYSISGLLIGIISVGTTKLVYKLEDLFEKLPVHWMWWPAIGGIAVGIAGFIEPRSLGVGYSNITDVLSGNLTIHAITFLCVFKFLSWSVSLSSGTSGGTLAPLLTIGGAAGALMGFAAQQLFPQAGITISLAALTGMSAMFAGASRALLTSIIFALETTGQVNALLPLLAACTIAYIVSSVLMENTIMTEKIARRGIATPTSFSPDLLEHLTVRQAIGREGFMISRESSIADARALLQQEQRFSANYFIITDDNGKYTGMVSSSSLFAGQRNENDSIAALIKRKGVWVSPDDRLKDVADKMVTEDVDVLAVVSEDQSVTGIISYKDILNAYKTSADNQHKTGKQISLKRQALKLLVRGQQLVELNRNK